MRDQVIQIIAGVILNDDGHTLLVRKSGTEVFMQPGGKPEPGESHSNTLLREIYEELGCRVCVETTQYIGHFSANAANENGWIVEAELYKVRLLGEPKPNSEIDEFIWFNPFQKSNLKLAPLTKNHVLKLIK